MALEAGTRWCVLRRTEAKDWMCLVVGMMYVSLPETPIFIVEAVRHASQG